MEENRVCLCLMSLYDALVNDNEQCLLSSGNEIVKSVQGDTEYYDLVGAKGLLGCDGEIYRVLERSENCVKLLSEDANDDECWFELSEKEYSLATSK